VNQLKEKMNIVPIPTTEKTQLLRNTYKFTPQHGNPWEWRSQILKDAVVRGYEFNHLYITSNKKIKDNSWLYNTKLKQVFYITNSKLVRTDLNKMVEATTDKSLHLPLISEGFVKKYAELQGNIDEVMVDMIEVDDREKSTDCPDWIKIVKVDKNNYITITKVEETWDDVIKHFQEETSYWNYFPIWLKNNYKPPIKIK
jgi:hypothetical protein